MTRVVRNAALLSLGGILLASAALANVPDPAKCTLGSNYTARAFAKYIAVEGFTIVAADTVPDKQDTPTRNNYGDYEVTVKDNGGVVIAGATVCIDFSNCPDIQISGNQLVTKSPNYNTSPCTATSCTGTVNGSAQQLIGCSTVCGSTNAAGKFMFKVQGKAINVTSLAGNHISFETTTQLAADTTVTGCAAVTANLTPLGNLKTWIYDVNTSSTLGATGTMNAADATLITQEASKIAASGGAIKARSRDDYNRSGTVTSADATASSIMASQKALTGSNFTPSRASYCP